MGGIEWSIPPMNAPRPAVTINAAQVFPRYLWILESDSGVSQSPGNIGSLLVGENVNDRPDARA